MNTRHAVRWLHAQLPELVEKGVLTPQAADDLRTHFAGIEKARPHNLGVILSAVLGATLLGAGVILLLAHNWDELSRPVRTVLSFTPLLAAQALSFVAIARRNSSLAWNESAGMFNLLAIGSSIALVGQTWHMAGDFFEFLLVWMLLALPLVYLLRATLPCAVYVVGVTVWAGGVLSRGGESLFVWPLLALAAPFYCLVMRENRRGFRAGALSLVIALALPVATGYTTEEFARNLWIPAFSGVFALLYVMGVLWFSEGESHSFHPFRAVGSLGIAVLAIALSFRHPWDRWWGWADSGASNFNHIAAQAVSAGLLLLAVLLSGLCLKWKRDLNPVAAALPPVAFAGWMLACADQQTAPSLLFSAYALTLGIFTLVRGVRMERIAGANAGMAVIAALVIARFFDSNFGFVARGLAFILVGAGFLAANLFLLRRRRAA